MSEKLAEGIDKTIANSNKVIAVCIAW